MTRQERKELQKTAKANCKRFSRRHGGADDHTCLDLKQSIKQMCAPCRAKTLLAAE